MIDSWANFSSKIRSIGGGCSYGWGSSRLRISGVDQWVACAISCSSSAHVFSLIRLAFPSSSALGTELIIVGATLHNHDLFATSSPTQANHCQITTDYIHIITGCKHLHSMDQVDIRFELFNACTFILVFTNNVTVLILHSPLQHILQFWKTR